MAYTESNILKINELSIINLKMNQKLHKSIKIIYW